jgi:hypothetical protein
LFGFNDFSSGTFEFCRFVIMTEFGLGSQTRRAIRAILGFGNDEHYYIGLSFFSQGKMGMLFYQSAWGTSVVFAEGDDFLTAV